MTLHKLLLLFGFFHIEIAQSADISYKCLAQGAIAGVDHGFVLAISEDGRTATFGSRRLPVGPETAVEEFRSPASCLGLPPPFDGCTGGFLTGKRTLAIIPGAPERALIRAISQTTDAKGDHVPNSLVRHSCLNSSLASIFWPDNEGFKLATSKTGELYQVWARDNGPHVQEGIAYDVRTGERVAKSFEAWASMDMSVARFDRQSSFMNLTSFRSFRCISRSSRPELCVFSKKGNVMTTTCSGQLAPGYSGTLTTSGDVSVLINDSQKMPLYFKETYGSYFQIVERPPSSWITPVLLDCFYGH